MPGSDPLSALDPAARAEIAERMDAHAADRDAALADLDERVAARSRRARAAVGLTWAEIQAEAYRIAVEHGFHELRKLDEGMPRLPSFAERIALIHEEASEALQAYRRSGTATLYFEVDGKPEGAISELADVVIRVADLAEELGFDLGEAIVAKMAYNEGRPKYHGKAKL